LDFGLKNGTSLVQLPPKLIVNIKFSNSLIDGGSQALHRKSKIQNRMKATEKFSELYELDFYAWTQQQAKLLQQENLDMEFLPGEPFASEQYFE
jgi:hypothetical protein